MLKKIILNATMSPQALERLWQTSKAYQKETHLRAVVLFCAGIFLLCQLLLPPSNAITYSGEIIEPQETALATGINRSVRVRNLTQNITPSEADKLNPGDSIEYTLTIQNDSSSIVSIPDQMSATSLTAKTHLIDAGGAQLRQINSSTLLDWGVITVRPNESITHTLLVKVKSAPELQKSFGTSITLSYGSSNSTLELYTPPLQKALRILQPFSAISRTTQLLLTFILLLVSLSFYLRAYILAKDAQNAFLALEGGLSTSGKPHTVKYTNPDAAYYALIKTLYNNSNIPSKTIGLLTHKYLTNPVAEAISSALMSPYAFLAGYVVASMAGGLIIMLNGSLNAGIYGYELLLLFGIVYTFTTLIVCTLTLFNRHSAD